MKNTIKNTLMLSLGVSMLTIGANTTQAATALVITATGSTNNFGWFAGFEFSTTSTIYVTELGVLDVDGGGITVASDAGIYNAATGALLATVTIPTGGTADTTGAYDAYFASIPELTLAAGSYVVAAVTPEISLGGATYLWAPGITLVGGVADSGNALLADGSGGTGDYSHTAGNAYSGATFNFSTTPIPEPSSTALLGLGGLALILRRRK